MRVSILFYGGEHAVAIDPHLRDLLPLKADRQPLQSASSVRSFLSSRRRATGRLGWGSGLALQ